MTQTGYFPAPSPVRPALWRVIVTTLAAVVGPPAAAIAAFAAAITWTGCFIECSEYHPNHAEGGLLGLLAVALLLSGPVLAALLVRSGKAVALTLVVPVLLALYFGVA